MSEAVSKTQPMRSAEIDMADYLNATVAPAIDFVVTLPSFEFGYSDSLTLKASSGTTFDVTFAETKAYPPHVFTSVQCNTRDAITAEVQYATMTGARIAVFNFGESEVQNVTVDWLAIVGR